MRHEPVVQDSLKNVLVERGFCERIVGFVHEQENRIDLHNPDIDLHRDLLSEPEVDGADRDDRLGELVEIHPEVSGTASNIRHPKSGEVSTCVMTSPVS